MNTGILLNFITCSVYASTFKLLTPSLGRTLITESNKAQIILASIEIILKPSEQEMLQIHLISTTRLREVNNDIQEAAE
jgi:hypothetical protein